MTADNFVRLVLDKTRSDALKWERVVPRVFVVLLGGKHTLVLDMRFGGCLFLTGKGGFRTEWDSATGAVDRLLADLYEMLSQKCPQPPDYDYLDEATKILEEMR